MKNVILIRDVVNAWIDSTPNTPNAIVDLSTTSDNSATARANLLGTDTSDPAASGENIYTKIENLGTAVASIMNKNQNLADFHPAFQDEKVLSQKYEAYIRAVDACPFLHLVKNDRIKNSYSSKDYNILIDQILSLYDGIADKDKDKLKNSIADMGKSIFSQQKAEDFQNLFSETTLVLEGEPRLLIYHTSLYMKYEHRGLKPEVQEQQYSVNRAEYIILPEMIKTYASTLVRLDKKNVDDWMTESTSQEKRDNICFDLKPFQN